MKKSFLILFCSLFCIVPLVGCTSKTQQQIDELTENAEEYLDDEKYSKAINAYQEAFELDPDNTDVLKALHSAYFDWIEALLDEKKNEDATDVIADALDYYNDLLDDKIGPARRINSQIEDLEEVLTETENLIQFQLATIDLYNAATTAPDNGSSSSQTTAPTTTTTYGSDTGSVFNIYCINETFKNMVEGYYPGYTSTSYATGEIGNVTINWYITGNGTDAYIDTINRALDPYYAGTVDDTMDMFVVDADLCGNFVNSPYVMPIHDLGITDYDLVNQFDFTHELVTDENGDLKALTWQVFPTLMIYRRDIAQEVFGTDDPDTIQSCFADDQSYYESALKLGSFGYCVTATAADSYRAFRYDTVDPWVTNGTISIPDGAVTWAEMNKELIDNRITTWNYMWSLDWMNGFYENSNIFCYFGSSWFMNYCMDSANDNSIAANGGWAACMGPHPSYWGGTYLFVSGLTDNASLAKDLLLTMTTDYSPMELYFLDYEEPVNNRSVLATYATDPNYFSPILGGQNPVPWYIECADQLHLTATPYDYPMDESWQNNMNSYFFGNSTYDEAVEDFRNSMRSSYSGLVR